MASCLNAVAEGLPCRSAPPPGEALPLVNLSLPNSRLESAAAPRRNVRDTSRRRAIELAGSGGCGRMRACAFYNRGGRVGSGTTLISAPQTRPPTTAHGMAPPCKVGFVAPTHQDGDQRAEGRGAFQAPPLAARRRSRPGAGTGPLNHLSTFGHQPDGRGNPPPRQGLWRGHLPPSATLSNRDEERVNGSRPARAFRHAGSSRVTMVDGKHRLLLRSSTVATSPADRGGKPPSTLSSPSPGRLADGGGGRPAPPGAAADSHHGQERSAKKLTKGEELARSRRRHASRRVACQGLRACGPCTAGEGAWSPCLAVGAITPLRSYARDSGLRYAPPDLRLVRC
jgi:hypothetical protein